MDLIIGVIGLVFYAIWYTYKKAKEDCFTEAMHRDFKNETISLALWLETVTDQELEHTISYREYEERILKVLRSIPEFSIIEESYNKLGNEDEDIIDFIIRACNYNYFYSGKKVIMRICMGLNGKLLYDDAWKGIESPPVFDNDYQKLWKFNHKLMKWLDNELHQNGVKDTMLFKIGTNRFWKENDPEGIRITDECPVTGGIYYWMPMKAFSIPSCAEELIRDQETIS